MENPMQQMSQPESQDPTAQDQSTPMPQGEDQNKVSIEITIRQDGSLTVGLEVGESEGESQEAPAASIEEALAMAKKIYEQVMSQSSGAQQQEDAAYQQEMGSPTR